MATPKQSNTQEAHQESAAETSTNTDPLATAVEQVKAHAEISADQYLKDAIVPEGGE